MGTFLSGAPWARRFFSPSGAPTATSGGRPPIRDATELSLKTCIDRYAETLLQWLQQISSNVGSGFEQELFSPETLKRTSSPDNALHKVVRGKARPDRPEASDTVETIKIAMDGLPAAAISRVGMAGLADALWTLCA